MTDLEILQDIPELKDVPKDQLSWLIARGEILEFEPDSYIFKPGDPIDRMFILLEGRATLQIKQKDDLRVMGTIKDKEITGWLPYSRADVARGYAQSNTPCRLLAVSKGHFKEMVHNQEELTTALVHVMSSRIREFTKSEQQNDKILALGKLSAGLAHELNNPSAAIVRSSQNLSKNLKALPDHFKRVIKIKMTDGQVDAVNNILFSKLGSNGPKLSLVQRTSLEDELLDWLEGNGIDDADEMAANLAGYNFSTDDLDMVCQHSNQEDCPPVIRWIHQMLLTESMVGEIEDAASRIHKLVNAVKGYTHMDQAQDKVPTDIHEGIDNTLTMLNHKLKVAKINLDLQYSDRLDTPCILPGAMNQVWTNLIDNAIDAMEDAEERTLMIKTLQEGSFIQVLVQDSGPGIPDDIKPHIFDPFFTTKPIGKGTGLGLEVVHQIIYKQHNGAIDLSSEPGKTAFKVCIPLK